MKITILNTIFGDTKYLSTFFGDFLMSNTNDQTKPNHSNLTQVRWTDNQLKELKKIAYEQDTKVAVYIRDFIVKHHPQLDPQNKDKQL